jgi:hypothetical protein
VAITRQAEKTFDLVRQSKYLAQSVRWSARDDQDSIASAAGKSFSALIASLGGPPGKVEG